MEILIAEWQPKGRKDRTRSEGAWICPKCKQRLATVVFDFRSPTRMCGGGGGDYTPGICLVLPQGIDLKVEPEIDFTFRPFYFGAGGHFEKTLRHSSRQQHGESEKRMFQAHEAESRSSRASEWANENLKDILRQRAPISPLFLTAGQLPATFKCSRPECAGIYRIDNIAPPDILEKIEARQDKHESSGRIGRTRKLAKGVWFG